MYHDLLFSYLGRSHPFTCKVNASNVVTNPSQPCPKWKVDMKAHVDVGQGISGVSCRTLLLSAETDTSDTSIFHTAAVKPNNKHSFLNCCSLGSSSVLGHRDRMSEEDSRS